jgi:Flp pilus assembly protein CpaB
MKSGVWALLIGILLAAVSVYLVDDYVQGVEDSQVSRPFLRLKSDVALSRGQLISASDLEVVSLPEQFANLTQIAVPYNSETEALIGAGEVRATKDVAAGSFLLFEHIVPSPDDNFASRIAPGMRALSLPVTAISSVSYFVGPGSRVDILATMNEAVPDTALTDSDGQVSPEQILASLEAGQQRLVTKTLLQNIRVMAVGNSVTAGNYLDAAGGYNTVTFEVTPIQAEMLTFAMGQADGGLSLVLRNPANTEQEVIPAVSWDDIQ